MKNEEGEREWERKGGRNRNRDRKGICSARIVEVVLEWEILEV
jgi:hypothetical protein